MSPVRTRHLTRRRLLAAGGGLAAGALVSACGGGGDGPPAGEGGDGWQFTDDRGQRVTADAPPERVVAYVGSAAALYDFGVTDQLVGVFGPTVQADGSPDPLAGQLDVDSLTVLGNAWGEFNLEEYASLHPQLLVTNMWEPDSLWYVPEESAEEILALASSVGITCANISLPTALERYEELAVALGADQSQPRVADAKGQFADAADQLREAAEASGGLTVMAASASADLLYVSDPHVYPDLTFYRELGLDLVVPEQTDGGFFEPLSWENADKYDADLILLDSRTSALQPADLRDKPIWPTLPAVAAGQVAPWLSEIRLSYAGCAPELAALTEAVRGAGRVH